MENAETVEFEGNKVEKVEAAGSIESVREFVPGELREGFDEIHELVKPYEESLEALTDKSLDEIAGQVFDFGERLIESGLDEVREFVDGVGEWIQENGVYQRLGEFAPRLQDAFEGIGRALQEGLEQVDAGDVAKLTGVIAISAIAPELVGANAAHFAAIVVPIAGKFIPSYEVGETEAIEMEEG